MPGEPAAVMAVMMAAAEMGIEERGGLSRQGADDFFARHQVTSPEEQAEWRSLCTEFSAAQKTGLDVAGWERMHPPEKPKGGK